MRSKPPRSQGRDRPDRKGPAQDRSGKGPAARPAFGKKPGDRKADGYKGNTFKSSGPKGQDRKGSERKDHERKDHERKDHERKGPDRKTSGERKGGYAGHQGGFKKPHESRPPQAAPKLFDRPRPEVAAPEPAPKPVSRIDHGGGAVDVWLYGHHAVSAALANPERRILRLLTTPEALDRLRADGSVPPEVLNRARSVSRREIDNVVGENAVHQGVAMLTRPVDHHLEDVLEIAKERETCCVVLLDQVTDPHNVGAILRSAAALDAAAVITLDRRAANETGALAKSASGALDRISFIQTTNLARAIEVLKQNQFWVVGLEADGDKKLAEVNLKGRIAFVVGTEGEGLRRLVRESCDQIARLPINSASESLNVSNAAAIALYERSRQIG